jgi:L-2-hydroxyglutarate oxidase LhgO
MEPSLTGYGDQVIFSPTTSVMDTKAALQIIRKDLIEQGVQISLGSKAQSFPSSGKITLHNGTTISYDYLINAAGLDSLRIA